MKIAALCDFPYWEATFGTAVRYASLCEALGVACDLTIICTVTLQSRFQGFAKDKPYRLLDRRALQAVDESKALPELPGVRPDRQMELRSLKHVVESEGFDAVLTPYFNRAWMTRHIDPAILRIVDTHDCQSQRTRSFLRHGLVSTFPMTPEEEGRHLDTYDLALAMSDDDHAEFVGMTRTPIVTAPFRLARNDIYSPIVRGRDLLFVAAQSEVNALTLRYLMHQVLPLVGMPVRLHVAGSVVIPDQIPANVDLVRHDRVEDISTIYRGIDLALNPVYAGGGVKTKTLEALSFGVPIVTSDEGARGLRHLIPDDLVANDKDVFAWRIRSLLGDAERRRALSRDIMRRLAEEDTIGWTVAFLRILRAVQATKRQEV